MSFPFNQLTMIGINILRIVDQLIYILLSFFSQEYFFQQCTKLCAVTCVVRF